MLRLCKTCQSSFERSFHHTRCSTKKKYPHQKIIIIDIEGYAYLVPCVRNENEYFLKTIIPSRKATKKYLGGRNG